MKINISRFLPNASISDPTGLAGSITLTGLAADLVRFVYVILGIVFFGMIIYASFTILTSEGNPEKIKRAISILISAVLGITIALAAGAVTGLLQTVLGFEFRNI